MSKPAAAHIPKNWPFKELFDKKAPANIRGVRSQYILTLIENDLRGVPQDIHALRPDIMVYLMHALSGPIDAEEMRLAAEGFNQPAELRRLLIRFIDETLDRRRVAEGRPSTGLTREEALRVGLGAAYQGFHPGAGKTPPIDSPSPKP